MRKWAWLGTGAALLLLWAFLVQPQMRFQAAPEAPALDNRAGGPDLAAIEELGKDLEDVELTRVERTGTGVIEVDAMYMGSQPSYDQEEWNYLAKQIANHLAQSPANTQTVHVNLYYAGALRAEGVTTRSE